MVLGTQITPEEGMPCPRSSQNCPRKGISPMVQAWRLFLQITVSTSPDCFWTEGCCQKLGKLGSKGSYRTDCMFGHSCRRDPLVHMYIYVFSIVNLHLVQLEKEQVKTLVLPMFVWVLWLSMIFAAGKAYMYICVFSLCMPAENTSSALLLVGLRSMEQHQPHLPQAVGSCMIHFPLK